MRAITLSAAKQTGPPVMVTCEWMRYGFDEEDEKELQVEVPTPGGVEFKLAPEEMNYRWRRNLRVRPQSECLLRHRHLLAVLPKAFPSPLPPLDDVDGHEEGVEGKDQPLAPEAEETPLVRRSIASLGPTWPSSSPRTAPYRQS